MRRAGDAGVISPNEHFQFLPDGIFTLIDNLWNKLFHIQLDICVIAVCRYAHIGCDAFAVFIKLILVDEHTSRRFGYAYAFACLCLYFYFFVHKAFAQDFVNQLNCGLADMHTFDNLGNCIHKWIAAAFFQAERFCRLFCTVAEQLAVVVKSCQAPTINESRCHLAHFAVDWSQTYSLITLCQFFNRHEFTVVIG